MSLRKFSITELTADPNETVYPRRRFDGRENPLPVEGSEIIDKIR
jgi:hypothetical protein